MKTTYTQKNILKNYSYLFSTRSHTVKKASRIQFSYFLVSKKTHFICLSGVVSRNSKKRFSINKTYSITTSLKKQSVHFTVPFHSNAVLVL
jgi:hypothetical protein